MKIEESNMAKFITLEGLKYYTQALMETLSEAPIFEHKCNNCGGTVKLDINEHIFKCPYCDSIYAIGTLNINDKG